jgi:fatty acid desaturase
LGTPLDTEPTYFDPLNIRFIVESCTGIRALRAFFRRDRFVRSRQKQGAQGDPQKPPLSARVVLSLTLHACGVAAAFGLGFRALGVSWVLGMGVFFPFFIGLRQLLEHRDESARGDVDYHRTPHGAINRMFGSGPLASTFGGAGFNRHLLHHWEPQISYTRLKELETYLMDTDFAEILRSRRTTYVRVFIRLFGH